MTKFESRDLNLFLPPRSVPLLLRSGLLFGGILSQFGWIFAGFGMIFVWIFAFNTDPAALFTFRGELDTAQGVVAFREKTSASEGGSEHSDGRPVYAHHYEFRVNGPLYKGVSYSSTKTRGQGAGVTIEFPKGNPHRSRIRGMRTAVFEQWALFVVLFPIIGTCMFVSGLLRGRKAIHLLKWGKPAYGTLITKESTNVEMNDQKVYKLTFEFTDDAGVTRQAEARTHQTELLEDDDRELLLYDPGRPSYAILLDHLPGSPQFDDMGTIQTGNVKRSLLVLIIPTASLIGHGIYAYFRFFS